MKKLRKENVSSDSLFGDCETSSESQLNLQLEMTEPLIKDILDGPNELVTSEIKTVVNAEDNDLIYFNRLLFNKNALNVRIRTELDGHDRGS